MTKKMQDSYTHRRYERNKRRKEKKSNINKKNDLNFEIDSLEQRLLLSADPVTSGLQTLLIKDNDNKSQLNNIISLNELQEEKNTAEKTQIIDNLLNNEPELLELDIKDLNIEVGNLNELPLDGNFSLTGSGTYSYDFVNETIVAPGYSPGIQDYSEDFTQTSSGILSMEIGGTDNSDRSNPQFDEINVAGTANLDGKL